MKVCKSCKKTDEWFISGVREQAEAVRKHFEIEFEKPPLQTTPPTAKQTPFTEEEINF